MVHPGKSGVNESVDQFLQIPGIVKDMNEERTDVLDIIW